MEQTFTPPTTKQLPEMLKVLCILTFIGVGILNFVSGTYNYLTIDKKIAEMDKQIETIQQSGNSTAISIMQSAEEAVIKAQQNKTVLFIVNILGGLLCLVGALMMWKLNKNGFFLYTIGELLPTIVQFVFVGMGTGLFAIITAAFAIVIPMVFIILYATQLKEMK